MAVTSKPKHVEGDVSTTLTSVYNAPAAVPSEWGAGYASAQLKHLSICNLSTSLTAQIYVTIGTKGWLSGYSVGPSESFDWEGTKFLSSSMGISIDGSSAASSLCDYQIDVVEFTT